jgi:chromate transporter
MWLPAMGVLTFLCDGTSAFTQIGWFFTKATLPTFGGAYAVLPYVYQGTVEHYQCVTPAQMVDGLALVRPRRTRSSCW